MFVYLKKIAIKTIIFLPLFLLTLEMCARIEDAILYNAPFFYNYTFDSMLYTYDKYGKTGRPNGRFQKWQLNSFGFRGDEIELNKPQYVTRIVCVGASETFGYYETPRHEWPAQLSDILDAYKKGCYEVINTALPGRRLQSNTVHLKERVLRFKPDIVIFYPSGLYYMDPDFKQRSMKKPKNVQTNSPRFSITGVGRGAFENDRHTFESNIAIHKKPSFILGDVRAEIA